MAKAAGALGQTFAGAALADDLVALDVLAAADGVDPDRLGTFGFSGGGGRSLLLAALDHRVRAAVVSCMMATFASLVPAGLDTPLLAAARPRAVVAGGLAGPDRRWAGPGSWCSTGPRTSSSRPPGWPPRTSPCSAGTGAARGTAAPFAAGDHAFDPAMQQEAWDFLAEAL